MLVIGALCASVVAYLSLAFASGQQQGDPPSIAMGYSIALAPFLVAAWVLLTVGGLGAVRSVTVHHDRAVIMVVVGVPVLLVLLLGIPSWLLT